MGSLGRITSEKHRCQVFIGHLTLEVTTLEENLKFLTEESTSDQSDFELWKKNNKNFDFAARGLLSVKIVTFIDAIASWVTKSSVIAWLAQSLPWWWQEKIFSELTCVHGLVVVRVNLILPNSRAYASIPAK